jgi:2-oxo-3-hexenedioate decarboxylase
MSYSWRQVSDGACKLSTVRTAERITTEVMLLLGTGQQIEPFSKRYPDFDFEVAYEVVSQVRDHRKDRGEISVGRKIGFTNRSIWSALGISAPIWNYVFDQTLVHATGDPASIALRGMPEPRIEPEVVLHLASAPGPGMSTTDLLQCLDWVAPGFEVVYSIFPNWDFTAADAAAAYGVHGALFVGEKLHLAQTRAGAALELSTFNVKLENDKGVSRQGRAENVLGGPLQALMFLVEEIDRIPFCEPLYAGELVTTGTLTEAMPVRDGETWCAHFEGIEFRPLQLRIC